MEAVMFKIYTRPDKFSELVEVLKDRGLKVVVSYRADRSEEYDEILVYQGLDEIELQNE
ncbi:MULTISPECIES: hypothetical protein [Cyanophyceae]|uniref:Uncharacterized protein n=1 Tax=Scytonema millei VB511283 TaxID=1245923 RepID=A0A9X5I557_9CYAN|nr:hypothetical protein [Scytonema millei]NHC35354.1 hypothetical protein [Scytonema millei VB511283]